VTQDSTITREGQIITAQNSLNRPNLEKPVHSSRVVAICMPAIHRRKGLHSLRHVKWPVDGIYALQPFTFSCTINHYYQFLLSLNLRTKHLFTHKITMYQLQPLYTVKGGCRVDRFVCLKNSHTSISQYKTLITRTCLMRKQVEGISETSGSKYNQVWSR
jgi:hypothetical protein